ncbi:probable serine/threonine-protein kinase roco5 isoform X2 [Anneissia japonica]|uniref:probable serine/threonine-protein kinase roco5 isoform X2 n=1 Tax=Anneissia japonica TaxID=1529436 RepID=UPI001425BA65|nr:probable serine/threonine-protein kinase roco5 isoform X2 [Anneissia japonica]
MLRGDLRHYVAKMLHRKMCYVKDKGKEHTEIYSTKSSSIEPSFIKSSQGMDESQPSVSQELPSKGTMNYESHIVDICNSLRMFGYHMIPNEEIISDEQIIQLMSNETNWRNKKHLLNKLKIQSSEDIGKIFAHVLIAVEDEQDVLGEIHELCTDDVVSSLSGECKKLNFKYNITEYDYRSKVTVLFLIHLLFNASRLENLILFNCNITGVTVEKIVDAMHGEGVMLELTEIDISENNLNDIKGSSLVTLFVLAPKLIHLDMSNCSLSSAFMDDMVKECSSRGVVLKLTKLNISKTNLKNIKGSSLSMLLAVAPKLNDLDMSNCNLSGVIIDDMVKDYSSKGVILELKRLNISENNLNAIKCSSLATMLTVAPKLNTLYMINCSLSDAMDDMVKECSGRGELSHLDISKNTLNYIKGSSLATLLSFASKQLSLYIRNCSLSGAIMEDMVKECSSRRIVLKLTYLNICGNNLSDIKGVSLATLLAVAPKLNYLDISNCGLTGAIMDEMVKECSRNGVVLKLTEIDISENNLNNIKGSSLATLLAVTPKLNDLIMSNCSLSGAIIDDMVKEHSSRKVVLQLTEIDISKNNLKDSKGSSLSTLFALAPKLNDLDISNCSLSGAIMDDMFKKFYRRGLNIKCSSLATCLL